MKSKVKKGKVQSQKFVSMPVTNAHAAGIDVGSRSHYAAVGQNLDEDVRKFGVYDQDLRECAIWLKSRGVETVAMESTGSYWQNLYDVLIEFGFEVFLVPGRQTKNYNGKTDVKDCRWIQFLHSVGLFSSRY
jgi:transposase